MIKLVDNNLIYNNIKKIINWDYLTKKYRIRVNYKGDFWSDSKLREKIFSMLVEYMDFYPIGKIILESENSIIKISERGINTIKEFIKFLKNKKRMNYDKIAEIFAREELFEEFIIGKFESIELIHGDEYQKYNTLLKKVFLLEEKPIITQNYYKLIDTYRVSLFQIKILAENNSIEKFYMAEPLLEGAPLEKYLEEIRNNVFNRLENIYKLEDLLSIIEEYAKNKLCIDSMSVSNEVIRFLAYKCLGFGNVLPLLLDDNVEEIYLDGPLEYFYLDHRKYGRCKTNIRLENPERFITRIRLESRRPLDFSCPSLKCDIKTKDFFIRVNIDIKPLAVSGLSLNIRKHRKKVLTL